MPTTEFLITSLIVVLIPGTGVIFTVSAGLMQGRRAAFLASIGCTLGIIPHLLATVLGLAAVMHASALAFEVLKYAGVAYLLYLAVATWRDRSAFTVQSVKDGHGPSGLGSAAVSSRSALPRQISPGQARDAGNGHSLAKSRNAAWRYLPRNPSGRACFCAMRRYSSFVWNDQTSLLMPCLAQKQAPARPRTKWQQTLVTKAFLLNILNPKLTIFFLAFLPQFVESGSSSPSLQLLSLSAVFMLMTFAVFAVYGLLADTFRTAVIESARVQAWLRRGFAGAFAGLGAQLALSGRDA
ncbi:LysE family translocator [Stutzerimonas nitrititolerans]|uniref:LysE family translocator n=2 Tax=Stutzerimonas nitrititolerans TaxID=2482751 RepID=UPI000F799F89|nr:LysE family translocator [Stutzerimonas nitrititolerans]RRV26515.1 LysE family translocator [Pseudomonas sp. s199]